MAGNDRKLSSFDEMGYDNSTKVLIPALKYSSNDPNASIENRNIPLELFYRQPLFKYDWYEYLLNDPNWIRCDTFSWHSGDSNEANSYVRVYDHLLNDISGKTLQSETISGITIQFYLADDTHKICPASEEQNLINLYNTTGIAWYYLIDEENIRFKLPRTKWGFVGYRDEVAGYIEQQIKIPNHYHIISTMGNNQGSFVATNTADTIDRADTTDIGVGNRGWNGRGDGGGFASNTNQFTGSLITTVAKEAQSKNGYEYGAYGNSTLVQPPATQMYLYCYVGGFTQTSLENIAGQNMSIVNQKADTNLLNTDNNVDFIIDSQEPTAENNYTGYELYRSGKVYQYGYWNYYNSISAGSNVNTTINLPIKMQFDSNKPVNYYSFVACQYSNTNKDMGEEIRIHSLGATSFEITVLNRNSGTVSGIGVGFSWFVYGKADLT